MPRIKISELAEQANLLLDGIAPKSLSRSYEGSGRSKELTLSSEYGVAELNIYSTCLLVMYQGYLDSKDKNSSFNNDLLVKLCKNVLDYFDSETHGDALKLRAKLEMEIKMSIVGANHHFAISNGKDKTKSKIKIMGISVNKEGLRLKLFVDDEEITITAFDTHGNEK